MIIMTGIGYADKVRPKEQKAWQNVLEIHNSGDAVRTVREINRFRRRFPGSDFDDRALILLSSLEKDYYRVISYYTLFLQKYPNHTAAEKIRWNLAQTYYLHSNYTEAALQFEKYRMQYTLSPRRIEAAYWLGIIYVNQNQFVAAEEAFTGCITNDGDYHDWGLLGMAQIPHLQGKNLEAIAAYNEAISIITNREVIVIALAHLAELYFQTTDYKHALYVYQIVYQQFPLSYEAERAGAQIRLIRSRHPDLTESRPSAFSMKHYQTGKTASVSDTSATVVHTTSSSINTVSAQLPAHGSVIVVAPGDGAIPAVGWSIQVGAFKERARAANLRSLFSGKGYTNTYIMPVAVKGVTWYRVRLGPYTSKRDALQAMDVISRAIKVTPTVIKN